MHVKAKFVCTSVKVNDEYQQTSVSFTAAIEGEENKTWSKYTPSGSISMLISHETEASKAFEQGKSYYLTFEPAE